MLSSARARGSAPSAVHRWRRRRRSGARRCRNSNATNTMAASPPASSRSGGTLGILIPPSVILVVYAIATEQNIAKLFMAALVPGVLAALFYCVVIFILVRRRPDLAPAPVHAKSGRNAAGRRRRVASSRDRVRGGGRHLRRRVHADRRGGRGRRGDVRHRPRATRARMAADPPRAAADGRPPRE